MSTNPSGLAVYERAPLEGAGAPPSWPYLLVHGSMDRASSFRRLEARLPEASIITYDRRGYAGSALVPASEDFADQVADLVEVLRGRQVVALGHSFGGGVVLGAAQDHPELIRAAVVWEPPMPWLASWPRTTAGAAVLTEGGDPADAAEAFMRRMVGDRIWDRLPAKTRLARRQEGPALFAEMRSLRQSGMWDPAAVTIPVIVGTGGESRDHHQRSVPILARALPHGQLVQLPDADHGAHLSHPARLAELLRRATSLAQLAAGMGTVTAAGAESVRSIGDKEPS